MTAKKYFWQELLTILFLLLLSDISGQLQSSSASIDFANSRRRLQETSSDPTNIKMAKVYPGYFCQLPQITMPRDAPNLTLSDIHVTLLQQTREWQLENSSLMIDSQLGKISDIRVKYSPVINTSSVNRVNQVQITGRWGNSENIEEKVTEKTLPLVVATDLGFVRRQQGEEPIQLHWGETVTALPLMKTDVECEGFSDGLVVKALSRPVELEYAKLYFDSGVLYMSGVLPSLPNSKHRSSSSTASRKNIVLVLSVTHRTENLKSSEISVRFEVTSSDGGFTSSDLFLAAVLFGFICLLVTLIVLLTKEGENSKNAVKDAINPGLAAGQTPDNNMLSQSVVDWTKADTSASKVDQTVVDELYMFKDAQYKEQRKRRSLFQADDNRPAELQIPQVNIQDANISQMDSAFKQPNLSMNSSFMKQTMDLSPIRGHLPAALDLHLETPQRTPLDASKPFKSPIPLDSVSPATKDPEYPYETPDNRGKVQERYRHSKTITEFDSRPPTTKPELQKASLQAKSELGMIHLMHTPITPEPKYAQIKRRNLGADKHSQEGKLSFAEGSELQAQPQTMLSGGTQDSHRSAVSVHSHMSPRQADPIAVVSRYEYPSATAESGENSSNAKQKPQNPAQMTQKDQKP